MTAGKIIFKLMLSVSTALAHGAPRGSEFAPQYARSTGMVWGFSLVSGLGAPASRSWGTRGHFCPGLLHAVIKERPLLVRDSL